MSIPEQELYFILKQKFPNATIKLTDTAGDNDHYSLEISDSSFKDMSLIEQHKCVNYALSDLLHTKLHSITIKTIRPSAEKF